MKQWHWILLGFLTLLSLAAEFSMDYHGDHWWSSIPAFYIIFGLVGCAVIILFSKALGKLFLQKKEDYYDVE